METDDLAELIKEIERTTSAIRDYAQGNPKEIFVARYGHPFLLEKGLFVAKELNPFSTIGGGVYYQEKTGEHPITDQKPVTDETEKVTIFRPPSFDQAIYPIARRPGGGNFFDFMVSAGRAPNNDIVILDSAVSALHFSFQKETDTWYLVDRKSRNGTLLNGELLTPEQKYPIADEAIIHLKVSEKMFQFYQNATLWEHLKKTQ